ncbi:MAG TPA: transglycosylase domain-containing protein [Rhodocyclaceae bacterium]|nr:transglycosylase domain-containing protein [Rhodocyclaceae bacterium]
MRRSEGDRATACERRQRPRRALKWSLYALALIGVAAAAVAIAVELRTSALQARHAVRLATSLDYALASGPSDAIRFPHHGPFDERLGYAQLPRFAARLGARGFAIERQVRFSPQLLAYTELGLFPPYREKTHAGLHIDADRGEPLYRFGYPQHGYAAFGDIPPVVVAALLFIENRGLLDTDRPKLNPAVDWPRFTKASFAQLARLAGAELDAPGASTLATQIEKYRHSPHGLTHSPQEKLRQMISASVRAYRHGPATLAAREALVRDYLNSVPLSAAPGYGEVHGLGDGLWVWFGADVTRVNALLATLPHASTPADAAAPPADAARENGRLQAVRHDDGPTAAASRAPSVPAPEEGAHELREDADARLAEQGLALRQVLSLLIAQRRPSYLLGSGRGELARLTDSHLRVLANAGLIDAPLRDAALAARTEFRDAWGIPARVALDPDKGATMLRNRLAGMLGVSLYELDRLDLHVTASLERELQQAVSAHLHRLADVDFARRAGIVGERLLSPARVADVHYSFTLFEATPGGNRVRVQTDTTAQPLDINEGSKLELGSTAKLRVLATYLEIVAELHARHADKSVEALRATPVDRQDVLSRWALDYLIAAPDRSLPAMLDAALERRYSAGTAEAFFTGGGLHRFSNFRAEDGGRHPSVREALQASINLPFVRLLRDVVRHTMYAVPGSTAKLLEDGDDARRADYLARFADREGRAFLLRFWRKYQGLAPEEMQATLLDGLRPTPERVAAVFRYLNPEADRDAFAAYLRERLPDQRLAPSRVAALYERHAPGNFDLPDQGYIARVHPLELWLVGYLCAHPQASFADVVAASEAERQQVYRWLFRTRAKSAQDRRIYTILEVEAFLDIHRRWARLGYPFHKLVPSLATALGSSGDRPAALAELMGIIANDGVWRPSVRIERLEFAAGTPYHTVFAHTPDAGVRVMAPEVAAALRDALSDVVEGGTARRLAGALRGSDGSVVAVGGKTGTGDNRIVLRPRGQPRSTIAMNRTATFVFQLGPRHFGTLTAWVTGPDAASFRFTSALPVQILKSMGPILIPYVEAAELRDRAHEPGALPVEATDSDFDGRAHDIGTPVPDLDLTGADLEARRTHSAAGEAPRRSIASRDETEPADHEARRLHPVGAPPGAGG